MTGSFADLLKKARYEELRAGARAWLEAPWSWDDLMRLLDTLGVRDPDGFLAAGWWLPAEARLDQRLVDAYASQAEQAMAEGVIPPPGGRYTWDDVRALLEWCRISPAAVVDGLLWAYAQTLGEDVFLAALRETAPSATG
ncbi:MAG: hypothetical protein FWJ62_02000 [Thermaerobacter sp.]|nr:hypothetical protein [Bacillota bacterium]REJ36814.1 MAG: hypothetical protein DIU84_05365 [Bacillota bacterium]